LHLLQLHHGLDIGGLNVILVLLALAIIAGARKYSKSTQRHPTARRQGTTGKAAAVTKIDGCKRLVDVCFGMAVSTIRDNDFERLQLANYLCEIANATKGDCDTEYKGHELCQFNCVDSCALTKTTVANGTDFYGFWNCATATCQTKCLPAPKVVEVPVEEATRRMVHTIRDATERVSSHNSEFYRWSHNKH